MSSRAMEPFTGRTPGRHLAGRCGVFLALVAPLLVLAETVRAATQQEFAPGQVWLDTEGHAINAHGGGILFHEGVYYWYGEFKTGKTFLPDCNKSWGGT